MNEYTQNPFGNGEAEAPEIESIPGETKAERFSRLASARLNKLIKQFDLLMNCAASSYEYTPMQVTKMLAVIDKKRAQLEQEYRPETVERVDL